MSRTSMMIGLAVSLAACAESEPSPDTAPLDTHDATTDTTGTTGDTTATTDTTGTTGDIAPGPTPAWWELGMGDPFLDELVLYYLGNAAHGGTEVAEVLETARRVDDDTPAAWTRAWQATAARLDAVAQASEAAGHLISAGHAYHRSSTYLRAAMHYHPDPRSPDVREMAQAEVARFSKYLAYVFPDTASVVEIPYEGTTLTGYWFRAKTSEPAPTLIAHSGRDAWAEDLMYIARAGLERGYHTLLIDGPGQGKVMRIQGLPFRPDWEVFITAVVDQLVSRPEVDPNRLVLLGASMGGYLAPRAATAEGRLALVVANPGVVSWYGSILATLGSYLPDFEAVLAQGDEAFDRYVTALMPYSPFLAWGIEDMAWHHGVTTPSALLHALSAFTFEGKADRIKAKVLVIDAEDEGPRGQARQLYEALDPARRALVVFTREEAGQFHVQPGATQVLTHKMFDWLDTELAR
ncbi:MAG: alpha/beta fold hydrolase [Deltaproteobacteria bacterium]|nr:alpha/beta fold hydrolase [Deltaproteobacteria bacterium]